MGVSFIFTVICQPLESEFDMIFKGYSCMTFDRRENGRRMLTRGCKKRDACNTQRSSHKCFGNKGKLSQCILVGCCDDDLCNEGNNLNGPFDPKFKNRPDNRPWE